MSILEEAYRSAAPDGETEGLRALLLTILQAPQFLYRLEPGQPRRDGESFVRLTPWETAARLSYHFWGTVPDAELMAAAEAGRLDSPEQVAGQAQRLPADPRAATSGWPACTDAGCPSVGSMCWRRRRRSTRASRPRCGRR